jgi:hypothetical protein
MTASDAADDVRRFSPGASDPGEQGYEGEATVGDEGGAAGPEAYQDPFGRPDSAPEAAGRGEEDRA